MSNYFEYVVCKLSVDGKIDLFYAPFCANLKNGDEVLVDTQKFGKIRATVFEVCSVTIGSDAEKALRALAGAEDKPLKRVIGKFAKFEYEEDENNE